MSAWANPPSATASPPPCSIRAWLRPLNSSIAIMSAGRWRWCSTRSKPISACNNPCCARAPLMACARRCMLCCWPITPCACSCIEPPVKPTWTPIASALPMRSLCFRRPPASWLRSPLHSERACSSRCSDGSRLSSCLLAACEPTPACSKSSTASTSASLTMPSLSLLSILTIAFSILSFFLFEQYWALCLSSLGCDLFAPRSPHWSALPPGQAQGPHPAPHPPLVPTGPHAVVNIHQGDCSTCQVLFFKLNHA